jgi:hypothetical protein
MHALDCLAWLEPAARINRASIHLYTREVRWNVWCLSIYVIARHKHDTVFAPLTSPPRAHVVWLYTRRGFWKHHFLTRTMSFYTSSN